ncbi:TonB-dependent receptor [Pontibacter sp. BT310]|uniref:TonB-dependent receptor n=1 Tax=Pontibacter populi TaxID=890055 RepID=A0ABS6XDU9_9BACT|nr:MULTISPECIES: outer membrane beta-barrel protein [Pontibacter]MBJ6118849.1 TonB-dependent receptor [Pontibacter sp. BT310]MBR0571277.1 TonB-dependent receptor [Microvirga sp. STS03]MBW3365703.1 TonB-dependent receptor [Pontibacter populi]
MKQNLLLALCLLLSSFAFAQSPATTGTIKGTVVDSTTLKPVSYVTVVLTHPDKNEPIKSTFTKDNGTFEFTGVPLAKYKLIFTFVGYKLQSTEVNLDASKTIVDAGKISLASSAQQLKEVEVVTEKLLVTQDVDKLSYNVEMDPESKTITALDMLRKVPMLSLDSEENIKLNGSGSFKVLVNGKPSTMFARSPKDVFRSMPASSIKRIEVITDPPAKYDAEGIGGIINVITTENPKNGYNGSLYFSQGTPESRYGSANLTAKVGKFGFSGYGGTNKFTSPSTTSVFERYDDRTGINLLQKGNGNSGNNFSYIDGEMSFEIDTLNLLSAKFSINSSNYSSIGLQTVEELNEAGIRNLAYYRTNTNEGFWGGYEVGLDYQHTFKRNKDQLLTLSYKIGNNTDESDGAILFTSIENYKGETNTRTQDNGYSREQTIQADYVHPIQKHSLEIGAKTILRDNGSDYFYRNYNPETGTYVENKKLSNEFDYSQNIYAAYASTSLKLNKWGLRVGARLEQTVVDATFGNATPITDQDYFNLIPSIALTRTLKNMATLKVSFTQRIERPSLWYLNPYVNTTNEKSVSFGNPKLEAATSNVISLSHSFFKGTTSLNSTLTHAFTNNAIQNYTTFNPADSVSSTTYDNIGKNSTSTITLSGNSTLFKNLSLNLSGTFSYSQLSGNIFGQNLENSGVSGYMHSGMSYKFPKNWRASANMGYYAPQVLLQGKSSGMIWNSFSVNKSFLKDQKASVSLSVSNPFQKYFTSYNEVIGQDFTQRSEYQNLRRRFSIGLNYKFGKLKEDIKRTKRGIKNDDLKGGESKGGN